MEVTVLNREQESRDPEEVRRILDDAHRAWGTDKTVEEVDEEIEERRSEWERPRYNSDRS